MLKVLITGGSGLLGGNIAKLAASRFDVYATFHENEVSMRGVRFLKIDLTREEQLDMVEGIRPDFIIHCAALTDVDGCETYPDKAYRQNVLTGVNIAETARKVGAYLVHISTDGVFDGSRGNYSEDDMPNPVNMYGKTKLEVERRAAAIHPHTCIVRTNIYGWNQRDKLSLAEWMLSRLAGNEALPALEDIRFSPILVNDLAGALFKLLEARCEGILHIAGSEACRKLDFAYSLAEVFDLDKSLIKPISIRELGLEAPRPGDTSLDVRRAEGLLKLSLPGVRQGLEKMKRLRQEGYVEELKHGGTGPGKISGATIRATSRG